MLSAESASGRYPVEAVKMMSSIIAHTESDPNYRTAIDSSRAEPLARTADAIGSAMRDITGLLDAAATVAYTSSGYSALRMARERPRAPIVGLTPYLPTARRLTLVWGVHPVQCGATVDAAALSNWACETVRREGMAHAGQTIVISAGMPFGTTNMLRIAQLQDLAELAA
jgi:pyruvate kinase